MKAIKTLNRVQASSTHLLFSFVVALFSAALVFFLWYPGLYSFASGVDRIFLLLLAVDVVLGPVITFIVFNPLKKELKRDLFIVVLIQIAALIYGMHSVFIARPVYMVFNVDRFELIYANDVSAESLSKAKNPAYQRLPFAGVAIAAAVLPENTEERNDILFSAVGGGPDVQHMPQYYVAYAEMRHKVSDKVQPIKKLYELNPGQSEQINSLVNKYSNPNIELCFMPLQAKTNDLVVLLDKKTGDILEMAKLLPWL